VSGHGDVVRRVLLGLVLAIVTVLGLVATASFGASAVIHGHDYGYDFPAIARLGVEDVGVAAATSAQLSDLRAGSASRSVGDQGTSTTSLRSVIATKAASLADEGFIDPTSIRFSQSSVSPNFSAGGSIDDMAAGLRNGSVVPGDVPQIRVFESNGQWMTLDNRRLVAFQQAGVEVPYRLATAEEIAAEAWKITTTNGGTSITIRQGGGTWP
jgi:hypothetical protein